MLPDRRSRPAMPMPPPRAAMPPGAMGPPPGAGSMMGGGPGMGPGGPDQMQAKEQVKQQFRQAYSELKSLAGQAGIDWAEIEGPGAMAGAPPSFPGQMMGA